MCLRRWSSLAPPGGTFAHSRGGNALPLRGASSVRAVKEYPCPWREHSALVAWTLYLPIANPAIVVAGMRAASDGDCGLKWRLPFGVANGLGSGPHSLSTNTGLNSQCRSSAGSGSCCTRTWRIPVPASPGPCRPTGVARADPQQPYLDESLEVHSPLLTRS